MSVDIAFTWLAHGIGLEVPRYQSSGAAGADLVAAVPQDQAMILRPGERALIPCGFAMALPQGYEAQIRPRSGLAVKYGVTVLNAPGTIDADYRGEVMVPLINLGAEDFAVRRGDRIAQMVVAPVTTALFDLVERLDETERGANGFGSTGLG